MITPIRDRIVVKPEPNDTQTASGLQLVEHYKPEVMGTVVAVPERIAQHCPECGHCLFTPVSVKVGDTVIFGWDCGQELFVDDERYLLIKEADLSAILERV